MTDVVYMDANWNIVDVADAVFVKLTHDDGKVVYGIPKQAVKKGGEGSGNFGHAGRPGKVGGSTESALTPNDIVTINMWEENILKVKEIRTADARGVSTPAYDDFMEAMAKLPDYEGDLYRGIVEQDLSRIQILSKYDVGKELSFDAVTSTSKKLDAAIYFSSTVYDWDNAEFVTPPKDGRIVFKLRGAGGKDLESVASIPEQAEVVVAKGNRFKIIGAVPKIATIDGVKYSYLFVIADSIE